VRLWDGVSRFHSGFSEVSIELILNRRGRRPGPRGCAAHAPTAAIEVATNREPSQQAKEYFTARPPSASHASCPYEKARRLWNGWPCPCGGIVLVSPVPGPGRPIRQRVAVGRDSVGVLRRRACDAVHRLGRSGCG